MWQRLVAIFIILCLTQEISSFHAWGSSRARLASQSSVSVLQSSQNYDFKESKKALRDAAQVPSKTSIKKVFPQGKPRDKELPNPNMLRVISGRAKGKRINSPDVYLRPMMAKVRAAVFSTLTHFDVFEGNNTRVLDVFAGSGSVGIEALSRGACHATFVDFSPVCIETAMKNAFHCGFQGMASSACGKAEEVLQFPERFNLLKPYQLISLTPPYEEVDYFVLLDKLCKSPLIEENTIVVLEYPVEMGTLPFIIGDNQLYGLRNRRYGRTIMAMYVNKPTMQYEFRQDEFTAESIARRKSNR